MKKEVVSWLHSDGSVTRAGEPPASDRALPLVIATFEDVSVDEIVCHWDGMEAIKLTPQILCEKKRLEHWTGGGNALVFDVNGVHFVLADGCKGFVGDWLIRTADHNYTVINESQFQVLFQVRE